MVQFNELKISPDGSKLIINASILDLPYYNNVYIDKVIIDTQDTFIEGGPSTNSVYKYEIPSDENLKNLKLEIDKLDILANLSTNILYVYIVSRGVVSPDVPCGQDNMITLGVVLFPFDLYCTMLTTLKSELNNCAAPKKFVDLFLKYKALQFALLIGDNSTAKEYYKYFIDKKDKLLTISKKCNCYE